MLTSLGDLVNGALQVIVDFINLIIGSIPNPDPFGPMIEGMSSGEVVDNGLVFYWLDAFGGVDFVTTAVAVWVGAMIASAVFAFIYWIVKALP